MRKTRRILKPANQIHAQRDKHLVVESRAEHLINSAIYLIEQIESHYDAETAKDLTNRLINSIRGRDSSKFSRGIRKAVTENRDADTE
jgi:hypothetical protein